MTKKNNGVTFGEDLIISDRLDLSKPDNPDWEIVKEAKELVVKQICAVIEALAERDDFVIVNATANGTTISWRIICPTIEEESIQLDEA